MAFGYPNYGSPRLYDYQEAKQKWESIKPIRGRTEDVRPLGLRRNTHIQIWKDGEDYKCRLYQSDCVVFKPNGDIEVNTDGWTTTTTASFISEVLGVGTFIHNYAMWVRLDGVTPTQLCGGGISVLRRVGEDLVLMNPTKRYAHKVKRKEANNVRGKYKDFRTYLKGILKLRDRGVFNMSEYEEVFGRDADDRLQVPHDLDKKYADLNEVHAKFLSLIDTPESEQRAEAFYMASLMIAKTYGVWQYRDDSYQISEVQALRGLDDVLFRIYRDTIFEQYELTGMDITKADAYAKYFV